jgi:hypothetical protein
MPPSRRSKQKITVLEGVDQPPSFASTATSPLLAMTLKIIHLASLNLKNIGESMPNPNRSLKVIINSRRMELKLNRMALKKKNK